MILSLLIFIPVAFGSAIMFVAGIPYIAPTHSRAVIRSADSDTALSIFALTAEVSIFGAALPAGALGALPAELVEGVGAFGAVGALGAEGVAAIGCTASEMCLSINYTSFLYIIIFSSISLTVILCWLLS